MKKVKIHIANKTYKVDLAETEEQQEKGLQNVKELPEDDGMLFIFDPENVDTEETITF